MADEIILREGKYKFIMDAQGVLRCLRSGVPWRDFIGDNAVLALFRECMDLREKAVKAVGPEQTVFDSPEFIVICPKCRMPFPLSANLQRNLGPCDSYPYAPGNEVACPHCKFLAEV